MRARLYRWAWILLPCLLMPTRARAQSGYHYKGDVSASGSLSALAHVSAGSYLTAGDYLEVGSYPFTTLPNLVGLTNALAFDATNHCYAFWNGTIWQDFGTGSGGGSVTSVGLSSSVPWLAISGSPITSAGSMTITSATGLAANEVAATPDGSTGALGLRALVSNDLPLVPIGKGGTGQATKAAGFDALSPMLNLGSMIYGGTGGTGTELTPNASTSRKWLSSTGTGSAGNAPAWNAIATSDMPSGWPTIDQVLTNGHTTSQAVSLDGMIAIFSGIKAEDVSGTNVAGNAVQIAGGKSTGTAQGGAITFSTSLTGTVSGTTPNSSQTRLLINAGGTTTNLPPPSSTASLLQLGSTAIGGGSSSGTWIGLNAPGGFAGDFANYELNGVTQFKIDSAGHVTQAVKNASFLSSDSNGQIQSGSPTALGVAGATVVVAASDSKNPARADFTCTGTNDQTTLNSAITAVNGGTSGGRVVLLDGHYHLTGKVSLKSGILLQGSGSGTILHREWNSSVLEGMIEMAPSSASNVTIEDMLLDGNKATYSSVNNEGLTATSALSDGHIRHVTVENCGYIGIDLQSISESSVEDSTVENNAYQGIALMSSGRTNNTRDRISGCRTIGNGAGGILTNLTTGIVIANNTSDGDTGGITLENADEVVIANNVVSGSLLTGINVSSTSPSNNCVLANNTVISPTQHAFALDQMTNGTVTGNVAKGAGTGYDGFNLSNLTAVALSGNLAVSNARYGINVLSGCSGVQLANNRVASNGTAQVLDAGTATLWAQDDGSAYHITQRDLDVDNGHIVLGSNQRQYTHGGTSYLAQEWDFNKAGTWTSYMNVDPTVAETHYNHQFSWLNETGSAHFADITAQSLNMYDSAGNILGLHYSTSAPGGSCHDGDMSVETGFPNGHLFLCQNGAWALVR